MEVHGMMCPVCGKEMEKGFLQASKYLAWVHKFHFFAPWMFKEDGEVFLDESVIDVMHEAYKCGSCKKIIIDYSGLE